MELILRGKGLWEIVSGTEGAPTDPTSDTFKKYQRRRNVALTTLLLTIENPVVASVISLRSLMQVRDDLKDMFESVSKASIDALLIQLQNFRMKPDERIMSYVNRLVEIENKLVSIGHRVDNEEKLRALLRGLRSEFGVTAKVVRVTDKTFSEAVSQLVVDEGTIVVDEKSTPVGEPTQALPVMGKFTCYHCGRKGHTKDRCFDSTEMASVEETIIRRIIKAIRTMRTYRSSQVLH